MRRWKLIAAALVVFTAGCGSSNKTVITVTVFPSTVTVVLGGTQVFTASVQGSSNTGVNWSVSGSGCAATMSNPNPCGLIDNSTGLYHAPTSLPSPPTVTVTATSQAASSAAGSATVTLDSGIRVTLSPSSGVVGTSENLQITATVTGPATTTIASNGAVRSNNVVTITTTAAHNLLAGQGVMTISGVTDSSFNGTFCVATVPSSTTFTYSQTGSNASSGNGTVTNGVNWSVVTTGTVGTISCTGLYTAPAAVPSPAQVTIKATAAADPTQSGTAAVTLANAADPTLASISPTTAAAGSVFQDVYLAGTAGATGFDFFSTSTVLVNGTAVPTTFLSTTLLRARVPASMLQSTGSPNNLSVVVQRQSPPNQSLAQTLMVTPVRPAIVSAAPDSLPQCVPPPPPAPPSCGNATVSLDGGYYSPATTAEFSGQGGPVTTLMSPRQLNVSVPVPTSAGLFPLVLHNSGAAQPVNGVNLAIQPSVASPPTTSNLPVGSRPSAVAIDTALGRAVVTNQGTSTVPGTTVSVIDLASQTAGSVTVGRTPTGVAVDNLLDLALVVNQADNTLTVVDLKSNSVLPSPLSPLMLPSGTTPVAVGVNPLTHHALVANQSTNTATVIDLSPLAGAPRQPPVVLGTAAISTGPNPAVAIEPRLDWAIVTPGGLGSLSIVDLSHSKVDSNGNRTFSIVATLGITGSVQGIGLNTETDQVLLTDPSRQVATVFSLLDQTTSLLTLEANHVAAAVNPLTNIGITVNNLNNMASIIDLGTPIRSTTTAVGTNPVAVAIDPTTDIAVVVNQGSNNVTLISLGALKPLQVTAISPTTTSTSASNLTLTVIGNGFTASSIVRLDENALTTTFASLRELTATVPASKLAGPARYLVDVQDGTNVSNLTELTVIQAVPVGTAPQGVAIGHITVAGAAHTVAVVTNTGTITVPGTTASLIDLANPASCPIPQCTIAVGTSPQGVAILERAAGANGTGKAVVTNFGDNTATIIDLTTGTALQPPVAVGIGPIGVAINPDTGVAVVANSSSNSLSLFSVDTGASIGTVAVDQRPVAVAIDPTRNLAAVANATQNTVDLVDLGSRLIVGRVGPPTVNLQIPNGVAFDPVSDVFVVANSLLNNLDIVDPATSVVTPLGIGINPTSLAYNFQSSTLVTVNTASNTASVMDLLSRRVRAVFSMNGSPQSSVAVDPQSNLAAIVDQVNNQLLLVPLPR